MKLNISDDLKLPIEAVTQTFGIVAKRGVGKTYTGAVMIEEMLGAGQQVVVADPIGVWWGLHSSADGKSPGFPIVVFGGEHADVPLEEGAGEIIAASIIEHGFSAILDLSLLRKAAQVRFMTAFAETLYRLNRKPLHFAVDEADAFAPQRPLPGEQRLLGSFEDIVRRGRARGLGVTLITQRAAVINKNVLTQIEVLIALRTISPQDRDAIEAWIEVHGTEKQRDTMMADLPSLPVGTAYFWSPGWLDIFKKVKVRQRTTFDSSSTPKVGEKVIAPKAVAAVDLSKLGDQIKSTVEKAKENDPIQLKRERDALKKQLAEALAKSKQHEVFSFSETDSNQIIAAARLFEMLDADQEKRMAEVRKIYNELKGLSERISYALRFVSKQALPPPRPRGVPVNSVNLKYHLAPKPKALAPARIDANGDISPVAKRILNALAELELLGVSQPVREMVALMANYTNLSSTGYVKATGELRTAGYVHYPNADTVAFTEAGRSQAVFPEAPRSSEEIQRRVCSMLGGKATEILTPLIEAYPNPVDRMEVAAAANYTNLASTGFVKIVGRLRSLGFIDYPSSTTMVATNVLFLK